MSKTPQTKDYSHFIENVHLMNIRLLASEANAFAMMPTEPELVIHFEVEYAKEVDTLHSLVTTTLTIRQNQQGANENQLFPEEHTPGKRFIFFRASYDLTYQLKGDNEDNNAMDYFLKTNPKFNMYPYFREFVASQAGKMMLNLPPLPLLKASQIEQETIRYQLAPKTNMPIDIS